VREKFMLSAFALSVDKEKSKYLNAGDKKTRREVCP